MGILSEEPNFGSADSYTIAYPSFTKFTYCPEFGYYLQMAIRDNPEYTIADLYKLFKDDKLFNPTYIG